MPSIYLRSQKILYEYHKNLFDSAPLFMCITAGLDIWNVIRLHTLSKQNKRETADTATIFDNLALLINIFKTLPLSKHALISRGSGLNLFLLS